MQTRYKTRSRAPLYVYIAMVVAAAFLIYYYLFIQAWAVKALPVVNYDELLPGSGTIKFDSHVGEVYLHIWASDSNNHKSHSPVIFLHGANKDLINEWNEAASKVSKSGFSSCVINFHSNPKTKPGIASSSDISRIVHDVTDHVFHSKKLFLVGKSWGGGMAMNFVHAYASFVEKLILVAPASTDQSLMKSIDDARIPVFLAWAKDDPTIKYSNAEKWKTLVPSITFISADTGGHRVLSEYIPFIINFMTVDILD